MANVSSFEIDGQDYQLEDSYARNQLSLMDNKYANKTHTHDSSEITNAPWTDDTKANTALDYAKSAYEKAQKMLQMAESGEFDGKDGKDGKDGTDGITPVKGVDYRDGIDGKDGKNGVDGRDGIDGYTPQKGVDYRDGIDGKDGKDGVDGTTPVKGVDYFDGADGKDGADGYTPVKGIDYRDGTDGKDGRDGSNGTDGVDGFSPTVTITEITGGHRITITDKNGTHTADVMDGESGGISPEILAQITANTSARHTHSNKTILDGITQTPVMEETDPTVHEWAKAETKPTYTAEEVGALPADTVIPTPTHFGITEDMFTLTQTATKGVAPYSTSYYYTDITIDPSSGVRWVEGATYSFVLNTKVATSSYRNVRVRIGEDDSWHPLCEYTTSICGGSTYFVKAMTVVFVYKTTYYSYGALHRLYDANSNTYIAACETAAGTAAKTATGTYPWAVLTAGLTAPILFRYANTAKSNVTLNWNSKGAVPLWLNGAEISTDNYSIPVGCWNCYYDGTKWHVRTDGKNANPDLNVTVPTADIEANTSARHTHDNKTVLDGITSDKVEQWDSKEVIQIFTIDDDENTVSLYTPSELKSLYSDGKFFALGSLILEYLETAPDYTDEAYLLAVANFAEVIISLTVHSDKSVVTTTYALANTVDAVNGLIDAKLEALGTAEGESY